jgi:hypothetical protein
LYVKASVLPRAVLAATKRSVASTAASSRYSHTPSQTTTLGAPRAKPARAIAAERSSRSKSTGTNVTSARARGARRARTERLRAWVAGWSTSKTASRETAGRRCARASYPAPSRTTCAAPDAAASTSASSMNRVRPTTLARAPGSRRSATTSTTRPSIGVRSAA